MLRYMRLIGGLLLAVFVAGAVAATAAQAEEAPYWSIEGTRLAAGRTQEVTLKPETNLVLTAGTVTVTCTGAKAKLGSVLTGSNAGEPGKGEGIIEYSGCTVTGNGEPCEVTSPGKGEIVTEALVKELAYAANKKSLVVELRPKKGKRIETIKFTGTGCKETETAVTGVLVAGVYTDPAETGQEEKLLELPGPVAQAKSFLFKYPASRKIWLIIGGTGSEVETEEVDAFGHEASWTGTFLVLLSTNGVSNGKLWSPLV
jgi:hypothetical protein